MSVGGDDDTVAGSLPTLDGGSTELPELVAQRYRIVRWLGGGGMGRVYEALDTELDEKVALKVLRSGLSDDAIERFRREVKLTRRIVHTNVARMFDIGEHDGDRFLTMELVDGEPLTRALVKPLPWTRLQRVAVQICDGLAAAHRAGVIHRDLKPDNVLVERGTERVVITDFGIARGGDDANVTQVGTLIGTPRYMAPEQLAGAEVDARADLFALGVMLYELTTGVRPWSGDNAIAIAVAQATQPARPFGDAKVPAQFAAIVSRCLAIEREHRPASAEEIRDAIATSVGLPERPTPSPLRPQASYQVADETSLAVLPFSCAPQDAYIADGVVEDLVDTLSTTAMLHVRPAGIARSAETLDARAIGRDLAVDHVVVGAVRRTPAGLRVSARLIGVADGFQIWAQRIDGTEADMLSVSDQLSAGISQALSTRAGTTSRPMAPRAVDLYLRARAELRRFWGEHAEAAAELLEQAAQIAPTSAPVVGALAFARVLAWIRLGRAELLPIARAAVGRGRATGHGEALLAQALLDLNLGDHESAGRYLGQALARAPMSSQVHEACGRILVEIGAVADARHHFETALGLDPGRVNMISGDLARLDALEGDLARSDARIAAVLADPDLGVMQLGAMFAARIGAWLRDIPRMESAIKQFGERFAADTAHDMIAMASRDIIRLYFEWKSGAPFDLTRYEQTAVFAPERPHRNQLVLLQRLAEVAMLLGQPAAALRALRCAADAGLIDIVYLDLCPLFREVADAPEWRALHQIVADRAGRALAAFRAAGG